MSLDPTSLLHEYDVVLGNARGFDAVSRARAFAAKHRRAGVSIVDVDDHAAMGAVLLIINVKSPRNTHSSRCVLITQNEYPGATRPEFWLEGAAARRALIRSIAPKKKG